ncbi:MAG: hypothetical protein DWQ37_09290 [Planctomycetota bacterium]|nr:MAG: hypothetical protein DWQ37_09290 [Planctomycetota bacterium]
MPSDQETHTWPELAIGLYDKLTERDAAISYAFDQFELGIPSSTSGDPKLAVWRIHGTLKITTRNGKDA